jgi:hypothetical protein
MIEVKKQHSKKLLGDQCNYCVILFMIGRMVNVHSTKMPMVGN